MKTKVTLSLEEDFVKEAKKFAKDHNNTLSAEVTNALKDRMKKTKKEKEKKMKVIEDLAGSVSLPPELSNKSLDELKYEALKDKFGLE